VVEIVVKLDRFVTGEGVTHLPWKSFLNGGDALLGIEAVFLPNGGVTGGGDRQGRRQAARDDREPQGSAKP
jgi:hypothetical protein